MFNAIFDIGKEFVKFRGTTCGKAHQYGDFNSFDEAKIACASDQNCIAFHAIQSGCIEYRQNCPNLNVSKDDDFKLCMKNSKLKNEIKDLGEYFHRPRDSNGNYCAANEDCFHDAYVKSNELGKYNTIIKNSEIIFNAHRSSFENIRKLSPIILIFLVCIDQIPTDEHDVCPICGDKREKYFNCSKKWQFDQRKDWCKGYSKVPLDNLPIKDICKGTCNNCGKCIVSLCN